MVPRPASTVSRPQLELPEILMKESEPLEPVVNTNLLFKASYETLTPFTVVGVPPVTEASEPMELMPFSNFDMNVDKE